MLEVSICFFHSHQQMNAPHRLPDYSQPTFRQIYTFAVLISFCLSDTAICLTRASSPDRNHQNILTSSPSTCPADGRVRNPNHCAGMITFTAIAK